MRQIFRLLIAICPALLAVSARAEDSTESAPITAKAAFYLRIDGNSTRSETDGAVKQNQQFTTSLARMAVSGNLAPTVTYLVRFDVRNAFLHQPQANGSDGVIGALERAYIQHQLTPWLMARYGRQPMLGLSMEGDYSSLDLYVWSKQYEELFWYVAPTTTGVNLSATVGVHTFQAQVFDGVQEVASGPSQGSQKGENMIWALGYRASLFGGLFKPILTYDWYNRVRNGQGQLEDDKAVYRSSGVGGQFSAAHFDLDVEWDTFKKPQFTSHTWDAQNTPTTAHNARDEFTTYVAQLAYNVASPNLRPFVKGSYDSEKVGDTTIFYKRAGAGVEYRPYNNTFRYHFVIVDKDDQTVAKGGGVGPETKTLQYIIGVAAKG